MKDILQLNDRDFAEQRAHIEPYLAPYINFIMCNLEHLPPELLTIMNEPTATNGAVLNSSTESQVTHNSRPGTDAPAKVVKPWPEMWFKLLRVMLDILSYSPDAYRRGPELNAIRDVLIEKGVLKADVDLQRASQLVLRVFGWLTMLFEPPLDYEETEETSFSPTKDSSKVPQPGLRRANTWTPRPIAVKFYDERPLVDTVHHMLR